MLNSRMSKITLHKELCEEIIGAFYRVYNTLRNGFLEKVYENALVIELKRMGFQVMQQAEVQVFYQGIEVGYYKADLIVENKIIIELKTAENIAEEHECQLINNLRASTIEVGLILNFGKTARFRRKVFENQFKNPRRSV